MVVPARVTWQSGLTSKTKLGHAILPISCHWSQKDKIYANCVWWKLKSVDPTISKFQSPMNVCYEQKRAITFFERDGGDWGRGAGCSHEKKRIGLILWSTFKKILAEAIAHQNKNMHNLKITQKCMPQRIAQHFPDLYNAATLGRVVDKRGFWFQFCNFSVRFSVYIVCP